MEQTIDDKMISIDSRTENYKVLIKHVKTSARRHILRGCKDHNTYLVLHRNWKNNEENTNYSMKIIPLIMQLLKKKKYYPRLFHM